MLTFAYPPVASSPCGVFPRFMQLIHFSPAESLRAFIAFYGIIDVSEGFSQSYVAPPLGLTSLFLVLEGKTQSILKGNPYAGGTSEVTGQVTAPVLAVIKGRARGMVAFFHPAGCHSLFGTEMSVLTNTSRPLSWLLGQNNADALALRLKGAVGNEQMVDVMDEFFLSQKQIFQIAPNVKLALNYIQQRKGNVTIREIEENCFITSRSLERHFKICVGLSPMEYAKIFRFKCLIQYIQQNPDVNWQVLSEENGYYDQSHLGRYVEKYMNVKPAELMNMNMDFINYLLQE